MNHDLNVLRELPNFLQPRLRLFLSADLVGSTAFKQKPQFPITTSDKMWGAGYSPSWLSPISDFLVGFASKYMKDWRAHCDISNSPVGDEPYLWKANGDELIFVKSITDRRELFAAILIFEKSMDAYRKITRKDHGLDLKGCAWTAGFPVTNSEVVISSELRTPDINFVGDPRLQQFSWLEKNFDKLEGEGLRQLDFIGPSIDIGFRLASLATPKKFILSVETALLLSESNFPSRSEILKWPKIFYDGGVVLKGVMKSKPYPVFWINGLSKDPYAIAEDALSGKNVNGLSKNKISEFCNAFFEQYSDLFLHPFILHDGEGQFSELPENYKKVILDLKERWEKEKLRTQEDDRTRSDEGNSATKQEYDELKKSADELLK